MKVPLRRGGNQGLRSRGGLFLHHPRIPGAFVQMPKVGGRRQGPVPFKEEYELLKPGNAVTVDTE